MSGENLPCIHIGLPKAASKTIQSGLFGRHPEVHYLGIYSGRDQRGRYVFPDPPLAVRDRATWALLDPLLWRGNLEPSLGRARTAYQHAVADAVGTGLVPVFSWESLVENTRDVQRRRAENLREVFGPCRILAVLRHPLDLVTSLYLQLLSRDNVGVRAGRLRAIRYRSFEEWFEGGWGRPGHPPQAQLEYAEAIEVFADVFGEESVGIFLFEDLRADPDRFFQSVCRFVGIDPRTGADVAAGTHVNLRWTEEHLARFHAIRRSPLRSLAFRLASRPARRRMVGLTPGSLRRGTPVRVTIPERLRERVVDATREGNRRLAERWELPLALHDYPI